MIERWKQSYDEHLNIAEGTVKVFMAVGEMTTPEFWTIAINQSTLTLREVDDAVQLLKNNQAVVNDGRYISETHQDSPGRIGRLAAKRDNIRQILISALGRIATRNTKTIDIFST